MAAICLVGGLVASYSTEASAADTCTVIDPYDNPSDPVGSDNHGQLRYCLQNTTASVIEFDLLSSGNGVEIEDTIPITRSVRLVGNTTWVYQDIGVSPGFDELFEVQGSGNKVTFQGLIFLGYGDPRAIKVSGGANDVVVSQCEFAEFGFKAANQLDGTIFVNGANLLSVNNTRFDNNEMDDGGAILGIGANIELGHGTSFNGNKAHDGGAIFVHGGTTVMDNVSFSGNGSATTRGGAVRMTGGAQVSIVESAFSGNVGIIGSAISSNAQLTVHGSTFSGNFDAGASSSLGGAVAVEGTVSQTLVADCTFEDNAAVASAGAFGLFAPGSASHGHRIERTYFRGNQSRDAGGAVSARGSGSVPSYLDIEASSFFENFIYGGGSVSPQGGALNVFDAVVNLENVAFADNGVNGSVSGSRGGTISVDGGALSLLHVTAVGGHAEQGGNLWATGFATVAIDSSILAGAADGLDCAYGSATMSDQTSIASDDSCALADSGSHNETDPGLDTFNDYGFDLPGNVIVDPSSLAVDGADAASCPATDLNDQPRDAPKCDIGAIESF